MNYLFKKQGDNFAIVTWNLDPDYHNRVEGDVGVDYMVFCDIYDSTGKLLKEDCVGGVQIESKENTAEFKAEIEETYNFYFNEA